MNLSPRKLTAAHALLLDLLSGGRSMPVASCLSRASEADISQRTLYEARARLPIICIEAPALVLATISAAARADSRRR